MWYCDTGERSPKGSFYIGLLSEGTSDLVLAKPLGLFRLEDTGHKERQGGYMSNPRYSNGTLRRKHRARLKARGDECGICKGRLGPIHYDEPSDAQHPLSFVIDEIKPVSKWKQFGYDSPQAAAQDWNNLQAAHYICNAMKSNKIGFEVKKKLVKTNEVDGDW